MARCELIVNTSIDLFKAKINTFFRDKGTIHQLDFKTELKGDVIKYIAFIVYSEKEGENNEKN